MFVLETHNLVKRFDALLAVDDLSFSVAPGEIFGFLGGNGAGKTTTLRMVLDQSAFCPKKEGFMRA
jgi:ABC-2 type transport system ATP-binding protein